MGKIESLSGRPREGQIDGLSELIKPFEVIPEARYESLVGEGAFHGKGLLHKGSLLFRMVVAERGCLSEESRGPTVLRKSRCKGSGAGHRTIPALVGITSEI